MADVSALIADLAAEGAELDQLVGRLDAAEWALPTPAPGWSIAHQIAHLAWTDEAALLAIQDPAAFGEALQQALADPLNFVHNGAVERAGTPPVELLAAWRAGRTELVAALRQVPEGTKIAWFGPPMSAASMATARLMETWAHALDVYEALGVSRPVSGRIRHIAHLGVRTRDYAFLVREESPPLDAFRVELIAPTGELWEWGPADAEQRVTGPALDFCLLVTQRRNRADLALQAEGVEAQRWLEIAQAFAGPPGAGREPSAS